MAVCLKALAYRPVALASKVQVLRFWHWLWHITGKNGGVWVFVNGKHTRSRSWRRWMNILSRAIIPSSFCFSNRSPSSTFGVINCLLKLHYITGNSIWHKKITRYLLTDKHHNNVLRENTAVNKLRAAPSKHT